jgi:ribosomal protein S12 methylthiotransferase
VKYIDVPLQHIDDRMLRRMGRRMDEAGTRRLLERMRERIPGLYLRTTFISGFPGEGEKEHRSLVRFVEEFRFERLGIFPYSREEGTPAARMSEEVPRRVVERRIEELMLAQQAVAFAHNHRRVGQVCEVLVDSREGGRFVGRSYGEAPEIDPRIFLTAEEEARASGGGSSPSGPPGLLEIPTLLRSGPAPGIGRFVAARITATKGYDLLARAVSPRPHALEAP